jgi:hypothetical protein
MLDRIVAAESWIIDGNFTDTLPQRLAAADTVIYLDARPLTSTIRAARRRILHHWRRAPGVPGGDHPMFDLQVFRWIWTFGSASRPELLAQLRDPAIAPKAVILRSRREVRRFLTSINEAHVPVTATRIT